MPAFIPTRNSLDLLNLREFVLDELIPKTAQNDRNAHFDPSTFRRLFEMGWMSATVPKTYGGQEMSLSDLIWVVREIAYGSGGVATSFIANVLGFSAVGASAPPALAKKMSQKMMSSNCLWSMAMTEAEVGSDLGLTRTEARPTEGGFLITGEKNYITNATHCTDLVVYAKTNQEKPGLSCFYVPGDAKGLRRMEPYQKMGMRDSDTGRLVFTDVFVPSEHLIGTQGMGLLLLGKALERSKTLIAAACVGLAERALDLAVDHLTKTSRSGYLLIDHHSIRHELTRLFCDWECAWLLTAKAAALWDEGKNLGAEASMAKLKSADTAFRIANECIEFQGSKGFMADNEVGRILRDIKGFEIVEGPSLIQEVLIAKGIFKRSVEKSIKKVA